MASSRSLLPGAVRSESSCLLLVQLAPFTEITVAVGRTVCLFMDFKWARKLRLGSQAQIETPLHK